MEYKIAIFLNEFLNGKEINVSELSQKLDISNAYISYIKNSERTASKKFIMKLVSNYPYLKKREEELLLLLEEDKLKEKLLKIEKSRKKILGIKDIEEKSSDELTNLLNILDNEEQKEVLNTLIKEVELLTFKNGKYEEVKELIELTKEKINNLK
ncbi:hypothetical protein EII29_07700 [Leptotrichia sp. OH3620_COT-345]|uniref:hypothetical protein n=1 Tax=Leptotrichia sp. OH3620_COT-345 TaxID=2491048 RepID=UPI000F64641E|nr:hypothetical protein [Leptotrichia sp. OH3620_COT-345]RRD39282.1 hypothetical protein EII29_07700 [Leptotrichia sp. OH3620_COT-345]